MAALGRHENISTTTPEEDHNDDHNIIGALDQPIATGLRLWMLLAMILAVLLLMMIIVCCFIKIRIPRTKREIELDAALRRKKKICTAAEMQNLQTRNRGSAKVIVMSSIPAANQALLSSSGSGGMDADQFEIDLKTPTDEKEREDDDDLAEL